MFAARFDPTEYQVVDNAAEKEIVGEKKRKLSVSDSEEEESSDEDETMKHSSDHDGDEEEHESEDESESESDSDPESEEEPESATETQEPGAVEGNTASGKHSSVLKRFQKTISRQQLHAGSESESEDSEEDVPLNDVGPLPQPALPRDKKLAALASANANLDWLATPIYYQTTLTKPFQEFAPALDPKIIDNLQKRFEITEAFSVQVSVIETLLKDIETNKVSPKFQKDLLVNASTGSGKTLAYCIPTVQALMHRVVPRLRCIILVPTKPLIQQVRNTLSDLTKGIDLNLMTFRGDTSLKEETERYRAVRPDIVISTPGRLVDHLPDLDLTSLRYLIIDEADRLLNQSFQNWCDLLVNKLEIQQHANPDRWNLKCSKLIFSATLTTNSEKLSHLKLDTPRLIIINDHDRLVNELYQLPPRLKECYIRFNSGLSFYKPLILFKFLTGYQNRDDSGQDFLFDKNVLIFTKSSETASRLARLLKLVANKFASNLRIEAINSSLKPQERQRLLKSFGNNEIDILISTDLMSRGIDLTNVRTVLNYDLPLSTREYIHRIGRTARANNFGYGVNFIFGLGEWKFMGKNCLFNPVVNRNDKQVHKINVVRKRQETVDKEPGFELELEEFEKVNYEQCLKALEEEVFHR